jgi:hypothetical protein
MNDEIDAFPGAFPGTIKAPLDVPSLTEAADVVCQGEVISLLDEGEIRYRVGDKPTEFKKLVALFRVERVSKGSLPSETIEIEFLTTDFPSSMERLRAGEYASVFLQRKNSRYQFANMTTSKMTASRESSLGGEQ